MPNEITLIVIIMNMRGHEVYSQLEMCLRINTAISGNVPVFLALYLTKMIGG